MLEGGPESGLTAFYGRANGDDSARETKQRFLGLPVLSGCHSIFVRLEHWAVCDDGAEASLEKSPKLAPKSLRSRSLGLHEHTASETARNVSSSVVS